MLAISRDGIPIERLILIWLLFLAPFPIRAEEKVVDPHAGLILNLSVPGGGAGRMADAVLVPNVKLFVPSGKPATPFVSPGQFEAVWSGVISLELRSDYAFQAELNGKMKVEIAGQVVLEGAGNAASISHGKLVRLNKGNNPVKITFSSPENGDAFIRLLWSDKPEKNVPFDLVPDAVWNHATDPPELAEARQWRLGRELIFERRCFKCHLTDAGADVPELSMDAPAFDGMGSRHRIDWIAEWVRDPRAIRPSARMPKVLHGPESQVQAEDIALYLASLKEGGASQATTGSAQPDQAEASEKLFTALNCAGCHLPPDSTDTDASKIPLKGIARKFTLGALAAFLTKPEAHYEWIRMPNFKFTPEEAAGLAVYLLSAAEKSAEDMLKGSEDRVGSGKRLVEISGCLNCHVLQKAENKFAIRNSKSLSAKSNLDEGCLAAVSKDGVPAPQFGFTDGERTSIQAYIKSPSFYYSSHTHVPAEFAERQTRLLNCRVCHGVLEGFPPIESIGGKLKPEWMKSFIAGELSYKPRHWLPARMPAFKTRAADLAEGLVMQHGVAPASPAEPPINMELAAVGRKLVSVNGGFSCVQCHAVNKTPAIQVFESEGINLAYSARRLQKAYYDRWVRNPQGIDPLTKMPKFFAEDDKSPLGDILGGDIQKQLDAIWNYLRMGDKMQPPPGPDAQ